MDIKCIGIIAPSSGCDNLKELKNLKSFLKSHNITTKAVGNIIKKYATYAEYPEQKAQNLHNAFLDKDIDAIICVRGGIGASLVMPYLNLDIIKNNPKPFFGYSDITLFINKFSSLGVPCFHAPMFCDFKTNSFEPENLNRLLLALQNKFHNQNLDFYTKDAKVLNTGEVTAKMVGGCLTLVRDSIATDYEINFDNKILFLEDVGEPLYKIDQMIVQLKNANKLNNIKGVVLGDFVDISPETNGYTYNLQQIFERNFSELNIPVIYNVHAGHDKLKPTLPINSNYQLTAQPNNIKLKIL